MNDNIFINIIMDVKKWGPDGWKLLHSIVEGYPENPTQRDKYYYILFFTSIKYILPCIWCRKSFAEYSAKLPINNYLENRNKLTEWLYKIHNMVNDKLRGQGLLDMIDPDYNEVKIKYENYVRYINEENCEYISGWVFISCILFNFPDTIYEQEDWSVDREASYLLFLESLIEIFPFKETKELLSKFKCKFDIFCINKSSLQHLAFEMEKIANAQCKCKTYEEKCEEITKFKVSCKPIKGVKTCRNKKTFIN